VKVEPTLEGTRVGSSLTHRHLVGWKVLPGTNALAYLSLSAATKKKKFQNVVESFIQLNRNDQNGDQIFPFYRCPNPRIGNASDAIQIVYSSTKGRHIVASRDVDAGECLIDEFSAAHMTLLGNCLSHCYTCLRNLAPTLKNFLILSDKISSNVRHLFLLSNLSIILELESSMAPLQSTDCH
jgi:hypothetical protein